MSRRGSPLVFKLVRAELSWHKPRKHDDGTNHGNTTWFVPSSFNVHRRSWAVSTPFLQSPCSDRMVCASDQCVRESIYIHTDIYTYTHTHAGARPGQSVFVHPRRGRLLRASPHECTSETDTAQTNTCPVSCSSVPSTLQATAPPRHPPSFSFFLKEIHARQRRFCHALGRCPIPRPNQRP